MVIPDFKSLCLALMAFFVSVSASAQIYKWVDDSGQTHYSQQPPTNQQAEEVDVPPPPPLTEREKTQQEIDALIKQQQEETQAQDEAQQKAADEAEQTAIREKNCDIARQNLQLYQNNPGRRFVDENGVATHIPEETRQERIQQYKDQIEQFCQ